MFNWANLGDKLYLRIASAIAAAARKAQRSISRPIMGWIVHAAIAGVSCFVASNLDDIVVLMLFFGQLNPRFRPRHIVMGQYLGFAILLLASLPGLLGGMVLPKPWLGLLGFLPLAIGLQQLLRPEEEPPPIQTAHIGPEPKGLQQFLHPHTYQVAAVTIANGGDNISIYLPLFASSSLPSFGVIIAVFLILVALWCYLAYQLSRHPAIAPLLLRYGHRVVPLVLIGLGFYILIESQSYQLLPFFR